MGRRRTRAVALAVLYTASGGCGVIAISALFTGTYLTWTLGFLLGVILLLAAYWVRTNRKPWQSDHTENTQPRSGLKRFSPRRRDDETTPSF